MTTVSIIFIILAPTIAALSILSIHHARVLDIKCTKLIHAIYVHNCWVIKYGKYSQDRIDYGVVGNTGKRIRIWDWGYKKLIDPDIFERIKPFMN